jgi:UTP--glucose-1-phosphate uridylyltransferase
VTARPRVSNNGRVRRAVFPAAGLGTRFLPVTKALPKEMLPLVDKPTIQYGLEEAIASGIQQVIVVTSGGKRAISEHFDASPELRRHLEAHEKSEALAALNQVESLSDCVDLCYVNQKEQLGLGHAVFMARRHVEGEPFAVLLPDDVILGPTPVLHQLIGVYEQTGATVLAARRVPPERVHRYGIIAPAVSKGRLHEVVDVVEKPKAGEAPSNLAILGRYVLTPAVVEELGRIGLGAGRELQLTDAIRRALGHSRVVAVEVEGDYYDTGTIPGYLQANLALGLKRADLREGLLAVIRDFVPERSGAIAVSRN